VIFEAFKLKHRKCLRLGLMAVQSAVMQHASLVTDYRKRIKKH